MNIQDAFKSIEARLKADLSEARASLSHALSKGAANEEAAKILLRSRLPRNLDISTGFLIDCDGNISKQLDIIIHDAAKTPILYELAEVRIIPVECAYAVIEVKTDLTSAALNLCIENMRSVKSMIKRAFYDEGVIVTPTMAYGKEYKDWPLMYFVFAFDSAPLNSIAQRLIESHSSSDLDKRIDCIYTLQRGLLANNGVEGISAIPSPTSKLVSIESDALLLFYALISQYFNQAYMRKFRFSDYINCMQWKLINLE
jgi:hypothetical protein